VIKSGLSLFWYFSCFGISLIILLKSDLYIYDDFLILNNIANK